MKTNTKIISSLIFSIAFLLLLIIPIAYAGSCEYNFDPQPAGTVYASDHQEIKQNKFPSPPSADNLEFIAWQQESTVHIEGYKVTIDCFPNVVCTWNDPGPEHHEVKVQADGATVSYDTTCTIDVEFWLKPKWNTVRKKEMYWSNGLIKVPADIPDHGWVAGLHYVMVINDDANDSFKISDFEYHINSTKYPDPTIVPFDKPIPGIYTLGPNETKQYSTPFGAYAVGDYLYFHFKMRNETNDVIMEDWGTHEIFQLSVGGVWVPVDKLGLLAPYVALASTILVATATIAIYVKRRKKRQ